MEIDGDEGEERRDAAGNLAGNIASVEVSPQQHLSDGIFTDRIVFFILLIFVSPSSAFKGVKIWREKM